MSTIKKINTYDIGANAENIDWDNSNKKLTEIIGTNIDTSTSIQEKIEALNLAISNLQTAISDNVLSNSVTEEAITAFNELAENFDILNQHSQRLKEIAVQPIPVTQVRWNTGSMKNLREILGACDNLPYNNIRDWLEILTKQFLNEASGVWHELDDIIIDDTDPIIDDTDTITVGKFIPNIIKTYTPNIYQINFDTQIQNGSMYIRNVSTENTSGAYNGAAYIYTIPSNEIPYSTFNDNTDTYDFISDDLIGIYINPSIELSEQDLLWIAQGTQPIVGGTANSLSGAGYQLHPISTYNGITYLLPQTFFVTQRLWDTGGDDIKISIVCKKRENNTMFFSENEITVFKVSKSNGFFNLENNFNFNTTFNLYNKQFRNGLSFLCQANQPDTYEEWNRGISSPLEQFMYPDFTSHSANLISITQETARTNLFNAAYCDIEGNASFYTSVAPNTTYTISGTLYGQNPYNKNDNDINLIINIKEFENIISPSILPENFIYDNDNNITIDISSQIGTTNIFSYTFTTGVNTHYIIIKRFNSNNNYFAFGKIMLNEGSAPLPYAPYIEEGADTLLDIPEEEDFIPINLILNSN